MISKNTLRNAKQSDPEFAENYESGYLEFKIGVLLREARKEAGQTGVSRPPRHLRIPELGFRKNQRRTQRSMVEQTDGTACWKGRCDYRRRPRHRQGHRAGLCPGGRIGLLRRENRGGESRNTVREIRGGGWNRGRVPGGRIGLATGCDSGAVRILRNRSFPASTLLILNAGVNVDHGSVECGDPAAWEETIRIESARRVLLRPGGDSRDEEAWRRKDHHHRFRHGPQGDSRRAPPTAVRRQASGC